MTPTQRARAKARLHPSTQGASITTDDITVGDLKKIIRALYEYRSRMTNSTAQIDSMALIRKMEAIEEHVEFVERTARWEKRA